MYSSGQRYEWLSDITALTIANITTYKHLAPTHFNRPRQIAPLRTRSILPDRPVCHKPENSQFPLRYGPPKYQIVPNSHRFPAVTLAVIERQTRKFQTRLVRSNPNRYAIVEPLRKLEISTDLSVHSKPRNLLRILKPDSLQAMCLVKCMERRLVLGIARQNAQNYGICTIPKHRTRFQD